MTTIVNTTQLRNGYASVAKKVRGTKTVVIITKHGQPDLGLVDLDFLEDLLESQDAEFQESLKKAAKEKIYSLEDVFADIAD